MSVHFSVDELFQAIEKNDIVALEKAIFFLGANIHVVRICENLTPMSYAARLGHFEQVKILLADMKRYEDEDSKFALLQIGEIIYHAIPNRHKDMDFLLGLLDILAAFSRGDYLDVGNIFQEGAVDFLEEILEKNSETYIPFIVEYVRVDETHIYYRELFRLSDKIRSHPLMVKGLSNFREKDPLYYAVMANDAEEIRRLLPDFFRNPKQFPRCRIFSSVEWKSKPHFPLCMEGYLELMKLVIEKDDVSLFNALMNGNMAEILRVTGCPTEEQLFFNIFMKSLHSSSINIINHVLSLGKPSQEYIRENNWWSEYFYEKLHGNVISANAMKDFCELGIADKAEITANICFFLKERFCIERVSKDTLLETFDEIENFIRESPDHAEMLDQFLSAVRDFPKTSERSDLVGPLTKYGVQYSRTDVIVQMNEDIDFDRFNEPNNAFLGENRNRISVSSINCLSKFENPLTLLWESVVQCGIDGRVTLYAISMYDALHGRVKHKTRRIKTTNEHVASVPSLQKQCRLTIREAIHTSNPVRPTDAMLSLFVNKYLPKTLVNYLLFRDEDVHRPLHYLLVNLEDSDYPESEVDSSDSSEEYYYDPDEMNEMNYQRLMLQLMGFND